MQQLKTKSQFVECITSEKPIIVVFKADWCKDCHFIDPFMPEIVQKYEGQIDFAQVDRDELLDLCEEYNILGIPSFIAFSQGQEMIRFVSKFRKSRDEIEQFVDRSIEVAHSLRSS